MGNPTAAASSTTTNPRFELKVSGRYRSFFIGAMLGTIVGAVCAFAYGYFLLDILSIAATSLVLFSLPLVLVAAGALLFGLLAVFVSGDSVGSALSTANWGVRLTHLSKDDASVRLSDEDGMLNLNGATLKVMPSRYSVWAFVGGLLGVAACLTLGWVFMAPITTFLGVSLTASPYAMMLYSSVCAAVGGSVGSFFFGGARVAIGRMVDSFYTHSRYFRVGQHCAVKVISEQSSDRFVLKPSEFGYSHEFSVEKIRIAADVKADYSTRKGAGKL